MREHRLHGGTWLVALLALWILAIGLLAGSDPVSAADRADAQSTIRACIQSNRSLSVVFLVDESKSLYLPGQERGSDPEARRVDGLKAALGGLDRIATGAGENDPVKVDVLFVGFASVTKPSATESANWLSLGDGQTSQAMGQAAGFADRYEGEGTDYVTAFQAAQKFLDNKVAGAGCGAIVFFTDGQYALAESDGTVSYAPSVKLNTRSGLDRAQEVGVEKMCRPSGLMDQLAKQGIWLFTVGLLEPQDPGADFLRNIAVNDDGSCGGTERKSMTKMVTAQESSDLFFGFGSLLDRSDLKPVPGNGEFRTVPGLRNFLLRADTGGTGEVTVYQQNHGEVRFTADGEKSATISGTKLTATWVSDTAVEINGVFDSSNQWVGDWGYKFAQPEKALSTLSLYADADLRIVGSPEVQRGETTRLKFELVDGRGDKIEGGRIAETATPEFELLNQETDETYPIEMERGATAGDVVAVVDVPGSVTQPTFALLANVDFAVAPDIQISPLSQAFQIKNKLPKNAGYPELSPTSLTFGEVEGNRTTTEVLKITGGKGGTGCVWFGEVATVIDPGETSVSFSPGGTSASDCVKVSPGQVKEVTVTLTESSARLGTYRAAVPVFLKSGRTDIAGLGVEKMTLDATASIGPERSWWKRALITLAFLLIGLAIPLLLLHLLNIRNAKFVDPGFLKYLTTDVMITAPDDDSIEEPKLTDSSGDAIEFGSVRFELPVVSGTTGRGLQIGQFALESVASGTFADRSLGHIFTGPYAVSTADDSTVYAGTKGNRELQHWQGRTKHEIPLDLPRTWLFIPDFSKMKFDSESFDSSDSVRSGPQGHLAVIVSAADQVEGAKAAFEAAAKTLSKIDWESEMAEPAVGGGPTPEAVSQPKFAFLSKFPKGRKSAEASGGEQVASADDGWDSTLPSRSETTSPGSAASMGDQPSTSQKSSDDDGWTL